jgi:plastocyanin
MSGSRGELLMKQTVIAIVVLVLIVIGVIALKGGSSHQSSNQSAQNQNSTSSSSNKQSPAQPVSTNEVEIEDMAFKPADITVKKGTTITWTNKDSTAHTVTETDGKKGPDSQPLDNGQSYTFTYNETGVFSYHCSIHSEMTGSVTVTD